jgi:glycosyltransferase involved in cell wall biosynthesis
MSDRLHLHMITSSVDPARGGMERSVLRLANLFLAADKVSKVVIYSRDDLEIRANNGELSPRVVLLRPDRNRLMEPLGGLDRTLVDPGEKYRIEGLLLKWHVAKAMSEDPAARHVLISFFISTSGFVAQHVANKLHIPHIASMRGTDFSRDFHSPYGFPAVAFVVQSADMIVTTNLEQHEALSHLHHSRSLSLIYNAICDGLPEWRPHPTARIRLISDSGYSFKKGSHVLLSSVWNLANRGLSVHLDLFGRTETREQAYWCALRSSYMSRAPQIFSFDDHIAPGDIPKRLVASDLYCSASLGEGCSDSISTALGIGMPVVATRTGALSELAKDASHIHLCATGAEDDFVMTLEKAITVTRVHTALVDTHWLRALRGRLSLEAESRSWLDVLENLRPRHTLPAEA